MISENKKRIAITISKEFIEECQVAAAEWGLTLSQYFVNLARQDQSIGLTAQARCMTAGRRRDPKEGD